MTNKDMRFLLFMANGNRCCCSDQCTKLATDIHHIKQNTKTNRKLFPLFLESPFNKLPINNNCHLNKSLPKSPSDLMCSVYEKYLKDSLQERTKEP